MRRKPFFTLFSSAVCVLALTADSRAQSAGTSIDLVPSAADSAGIPTSDWASIRAAYDTGRHAAYEVEGGHRAHTPGQRWSTFFDGRGFLTKPDDGDWSWGLELRGYGHADAEILVGTNRAVVAEGRRVAYEWDERLTEWFVNENRGLEHGYTVQSRIGSSTSALTLELAIRGGLEAEISANGRDVRFLGTDGSALVTYTGLTVLDADGRSLDARFEPARDGLRLVVDDAHARYPLTIDPVAQQAYLKASNTAAFDKFGSSVAISGDTIVVGAPQEDSDAAGVNGDQSNDNSPDSGAAYVFVRNGGTWVQEAYLKASNTGSGDSFGQSVGISGDTIVVGAWFEDSSGTGVSGDSTDNSASNAGAAYVFVRTAGVWSEEAYLKASNSAANDYFGWTVDVSGDTVVVGAYGEDSSATGVDGDQSNDAASSSGAAYVYVRSGSLWSLEAYLKASNTGADDTFGHTVAIDGDTIVVGSWFEDSGSTGVNGDESDNSESSSGAAYVFVRDMGAWSQQAYLKASNTGGGDLFGFAIAISGDTAVVSATQEDSSSVGVNGEEGDDTLDGAGAVYVFERIGTTWGQQAYLKASNTGFTDQFGWAVAISGDVLVVAASQESSSATGVNGDELDDEAAYAGAAYVFVRNGFLWAQDSYLKASNTAGNDRFGFAVAISGETAVVGAPYESSDSMGVNGDQANAGAASSGATYVFDVILDPVDPIVPFCFGDGGDQLGCTDCPCMNNAPPGSLGGCINASGTSAQLLASGVPDLTTPDDTLRFTVVAATPSSFGVLVSADNPLPSSGPCPVGSGVGGFDGLRCVGGALLRHGTRGMDANGDIGLTNNGWGPPNGPAGGLGASGGFLAGQTRHFQCFYRVEILEGCNTGQNTTNAVSVTFL